MDEASCAGELATVGIRGRSVDVVMDCKCLDEGYEASINQYDLLCLTE